MEQRARLLFVVFVASAACSETLAPALPPDPPPRPDAAVVPPYSEWVPDTETIFGPMEGAPELTGNFHDVTEIAGIDLTRGFIANYFVTGQAWGDVDGDGWADLYLTNSVGANRLYRNQGDGTFVAAANPELALERHQSGGAVFADYDNDGDADLYVLGLGPNVLFENRGDGTFIDVTEAAGVGDEGKGETASWGDFDNDGDLDLYVANWLCEECGGLDASDRFYRNRGDGTFEDVGRFLGERLMIGAGFVASFVDYDDDNDLDIYLVNDKGYPGEALPGLPMNRNLLWRNDGPGCDGWCFTEVAVAVGADARLDGMGLAVGDPDRDGDLDFFFTNSLVPMYLENLGGRFRDETERAGLWVERQSWGTMFLDEDNDGDEDLFVAIGLELHGPDHNRFFVNRGDGTFDDVSSTSGADDPGYSIGAASADFDRDGYVDVVFGNWGQDYRLLRNTRGPQSDHHFLRVRLVGGGPVNRDAIGSRVYVETDGGARQVREIKCGSSLGAGNELIAHFGLGRADTARVEIRWSDGERTDVGEVAADRELTVRYEK